MRTPLLALSLLAAPLGAFAAPPDACTLLTLEEINAVSKQKAEKALPLQSGNPTKCSFVDARKGAVLVVSAREVQYAVRDEMHYERENLEKIYKGRVKWLTGTVGENGFWMPINKVLVFRKAKLIVSVSFSRTQNQNEVDSAQIARMVEARL
jgi:hypothetical protein